DPGPAEAERLGREVPAQAGGGGSAAAGDHRPAEERHAGAGGGLVPRPALVGRARAAPGWARADRPVPPRLPGAAPGREARRPAPAARGEDLAPGDAGGVAAARTERLSRDVGAWAIPDWTATLPRA